MGKRTQYGSTWWGQRWIAALERFGWTNRLQRGRSYARSGHVKTLEIEPGKVTARVAGSRPQPYRVAISLQPLSGGEWDRVITAFSERALFAATLLSGEMPPEIEEAFAGVKVPLFPQTAGELTMSCSCPDWANPCKHVAATYYRLGEEFDRDPFLLLHLRGRDRETLLGAVRAQRADKNPEPARGPESEQEAKTLPVADADRFWRTDDRIAAMRFHIEPPPVSGALLRRLGPLPGGEGAKAAMARLDQYYAIVGAKALSLAMEEWSHHEEGVE